MASGNRRVNKSGSVQSRDIQRIGSYGNVQQILNMSMPSKVHLTKNEKYYPKDQNHSYSGLILFFGNAVDEVVD